MPEQVKGVPEGVSVVIPRLFCRDPAAQIEFCKTTFGAAEGVRRHGADGKVAHALITIGPAMVMIESEWPGVRNRAPSPDASSPVVLYVYVENVDQVVERAEAAGAKIPSRIEETTEEERQRRSASAHRADAAR